MVYITVPNNWHELYDLDHQHLPGANYRRLVHAINFQPAPSSVHQILLFTLHGLYGLQSTSSLDFCISTTFTIYPFSQCYDKIIEIEVLLTAIWLRGGCP